ncbi:MAG: accessory gene regulator B family protein [Candidatus Cohnella colombiensis]|uniref:Accessory gene regulator B family protein n=1 Tax=Candidatus Cohnella colombiensis TaxID=3121368 RepID=A0AA95EW03_9BACL|nr:MAG: accessory gene regulator B family protein [Cohnella sp.]
MIERLAHRLAVNIKSAAPNHPASIEVLEFPIAAILNAVSIIIFSLGISLLTGRVTETSIVLVGYALLRQVSGGIHLRSGDICVLLSVTGIALLSLTNFNPSVVLTFNIISMLLALIYAPSRIENQTRIPKKFHPLLKVLSALIIATNFLIHSSALSGAYLVQALTLIRERR